MDTSYSSHNDNHFVGHHDFLSLAKQWDNKKEQHLPHPTANALQWSLNLPDLLSCTCCQHVGDMSAKCQNVEDS